VSLFDIKKRLDFDIFVNFNVIANIFVYSCLFLSLKHIFRCNATGGNPKPVLYLGLVEKATLAPSAATSSTNSSYSNDPAFQELVYAYLNDTDTTVLQVGKIYVRNRYKECICFKNDIFNISNNL
jgi:hypothetical protein